MNVTNATALTKTGNTRVFSYIDGFNLFYGLMDKAKSAKIANPPNHDWKRYVWLDLVKFSSGMLLPSQQLLHTKYFTSRVKGNPDSERRQSCYPDALDSLPNLTIFPGYFQPDKRQCRDCGKTGFPNQEKKTDVNIATQMIHDAIFGNFDVALLVSGDSDQVPTIEMVRTIFKRRVIVAFPPCRFSAELQKVATASFRIGEQKFQQCILPSAIKLPSGIVLNCPSEWI